MDNTLTSQPSDLAKIRNMQIGDEVVFPISKTSNVRSMCSNFGLQWGTRYTTRTSREDSTIIVTRIG